MTDIKLDKVDYIELYKIAIDEEHNELETHQNRLSFLTGVISAIFAATFVGVTQADEYYEYAFLCGGPILVSGLAMIGRKVTNQFYERFLDAVTKRAKLEQLLGLTIKKPIDIDPDGAYWIDEPLIPTRHLNSRRNPQYSYSCDNGEKAEGSYAWMKAHKKTGYNRSAMRLFNGTIWGSLMIMIVLVFVTFSKLP